MNVFTNQLINVFANFTLLLALIFQRREHSICRMNGRLRSCLADGLSLKSGCIMSLMTCRISQLIPESIATSINHQSLVIKNHLSTCHKSIGNVAVSQLMPTLSARRQVKITCDFQNSNTKTENISRLGEFALHQLLGQVFWVAFSRIGGVVLIERVISNLLLLEATSVTHFVDIEDKPEITQFADAITGYENVVGFDVQMNQVVVMKMAHSL